MRIAYVTTYDVGDVSQHSGTGYFVAKSLRDQGVDIEVVGPLRQHWPWFQRTKSNLHARFGATRYDPDRDPLVAWQYARQIARALRQTEVELLFSPSTIPIAYLTCRQPIVFYADATFDGMLDYYPSFTRLCQETRWAGHRLEQAALRRSALAIYVSEWAAETARVHYRVDPWRLRVLPRGANIEYDPTRSEIDAAIASRGTDRCELLFLGRDWERKGGRLALAVTDELNRRGLPTRLTVIGCSPEIPSHLSSRVRVLGFLSKSDAVQERQFSTVLRSSTLLISPTRAECFGIAFLEASAYGVPSLATRTGGVPSAVIDGVNGKLFAPSASKDEYCEFVTGLLSEPQRYARLAKSSRDVYEARFNWRSVGSRLKDMLEEAVAAAQAGEPERART